MAIKDPMALLEEEMNKKPENSGLKPFFFSIGPDEKALVRPLLNMSQYTLVHKHEFFNNQTKKYEARAICGADIGEDVQCQLCLDAASNKKLKADARFVLPIYVLAVVNVKTGNPVTYKNQENEELPVSGLRLLEMKRSSSILRDLVAAYNESDEHDITGNDFVIRREGEALETKYTVTPKAPKPAKFPEDIPEQWRDTEQVKFLFIDACPPVEVKGDDDPFKQEPVASAPAKSNGTVKSAPDF